GCSPSSPTPGTTTRSAASTSASSRPSRCPTSTTCSSSSEGIDRARRTGHGRSDAGRGPPLGGRGGLVFRRGNSMIRRRWLSKGIALLALLSLLAAACGGDDDVGGGETPSDEDAEVDPDGVLRLALQLSAGAMTTGIFFDATTQVSVPTLWFPM